MSMQYDVKSAQLAASESVNGRCRIKGILISAASSSSVVEIKDGGASGNAVFGFNAKTAGNVYIPVPGEGILCNTNLYMNRSDDANVTVFYG